MGMLFLLVLLACAAAVAALKIARADRAMLALLEERLRAIEARLPQDPAATLAGAAELQQRGEPPATESVQDSASSQAATASRPTAETEDPTGSARAPSGDVPGSSPSPLTPPPYVRSPPGLEERFGTRWVVWVGGVALALGAIFLVRYSIEQGLIGPRMRVFLGGLLAAALVSAGEWTRRNETRAAIRGLPQASIPAILTAAGTTAAFATVWAAHGLYGFVGPAIAFLLLGIVALATLTAALLHGPALAGLGLIGAYVTPLLVASKEPSFWSLYLYLLVVTGAAFMLARLRLWRWLAIAALAFSTFWLLPGLLSGTFVASQAAHSVYVVAAFALAAALIVCDFLFGPEAAPDRVDGVSSASLTVYLAAAALIVVCSAHAPVGLAAFVPITVLTLGIAWRAPAAAAAVPIAAGLATFVIAEWTVQVRPLDFSPAAVPPEFNADAGLHLSLGAAFTVLFGGAGFLAQGRAERPSIPILWAIAAVLAPVAILIALYYRIAGVERSIPFAALALLLAAFYAAATEHLNRRTPRPGLASGAALFAVGAVASLALALTMALEKGWLTVALALMAPGIAMVAERRPLPLLRWLAAACAVLVSARVLWEPRIVSDIGATPIFNWLLWGYGVPALSFWLGGHLLRRRADDLPARMLDSAAILFTVLTLSLQIRHFAGGGDIYHFPESGLAELGLQVSAWLATAIGLEHVRERTRSPVHDAGALLLAGLALAAIVVGLLLDENPLLTDENVGGPVINLLLLGYGVPALLAIVLALKARNTRPLPYRILAAAAAVVLTLSYLTLQVRRFYQGPELGLIHRTSDAELWTYSAIWLLLGVLLLLAGILLRSQPARMASAAVVLLTVAKVFLYDLAGIGGVWRALSFIGLGLVLVGIGWTYQRLLFSGAAKGPAAG